MAFHVLLLLNETATPEENHHNVPVQFKYACPILTYSTSANANNCFSSIIEF